MDIWLIFKLQKLKRRKFPNKILSKAANLSPTLVYNTLHWNSIGPALLSKYPKKLFNSIFFRYREANWWIKELNIFFVSGIHGKCLQRNIWIFYMVVLFCLFCIHFSRTYLSELFLWNINYIYLFYSRSTISTNCVFIQVELYLWIVCI